MAQFTSSGRKSQTLLKEEDSIFWQHD